MASSCCPRCQSVLLSLDGSGYSLLVCKACGGLFARGVKPHGVSAAFHSSSVGEAESAASRAMLVPDEAPLVACPECRAGLSRYRLEKTDVELDACAAHGIWFDREELPKLARSVTKGSRPKAVLVTAGAVAAGAAVVATVATMAPPSTGSGGVGAAVVEVVADGIVEVGFGLVGELISGIFS